MESNHSPLSIRTLYKSFRQGSKQVSALAGIDLRLGQGDFIAIMGASGSGKSTLLHLAAGLTRPDSGEVLVDGQSLFEMSDAALTRFRRDRIGMVFQAFNLVGALTAEENIALPLLSSGRRVERDKLDALLDELGIANRRGHRPDALSGGEQQRVAIARALITDPAIILADEPTGSLDSQTGQSICRLLRSLCDQQRRTIAVVTHEPSVAIWADRVVVLKDGRGVSQFTTSEFPTAQQLAAHYQEVLNPETAIV